MDNHIRRVLLDGSGKSEAISGQGNAPIAGLCVSPDGKTIAVVVVEFSGEAPKIELLSLGSPSSPRMLDANYYSVDATGNGPGLQFTHGGRFVRNLELETARD